MVHGEPSEVSRPKSSGPQAPRVFGRHPRLVKRGQCLSFAGPKLVEFNPNILVEDVDKMQLIDSTCQRGDWGIGIFYWAIISTFQNTCCGSEVLAKCSLRHQLLLEIV